MPINSKEGNCVMKTKKYLSFGNIAKKIDNGKIYNKDDIIAIIYNMINENSLDINEIIETFSYRYRYATPLLYIFLLQNKELIDFVLKKYTKKINPIISVVENSIEYDLLRVIYSGLHYKYITTDCLLPLIYHFSNINFLQEESSAIRKINITQFLINQAQHYNHKKEFISILKNKITEFYQEREEFIYSKLSVDITQTLAMINELGKNATSQTLNIKNELINLKNELIKNKNRRLNRISEYI